jgi:uncharacterized protein
VKAKRISLSMKSAPEIGETFRGRKPEQRSQQKTPSNRQGKDKGKSKSEGMGQLGEALAKALRK